MELKRILARDAKSANDKAVAQFGPDVLVISSSQVNGLTELIVAVDIEPLKDEEAHTYVPTPAVRASKGQDEVKFNVLLGQTIESNKRVVRERQTVREAKPIVEIKPETKTTAKASNKAPSKEKAVTASASEERAAEDHDIMRGREIVALVREELASLRREFKLSQQMAAWQGGMPLPPALTPLRDALNDAPIPVALRALLIDSIKDHPTLPEAMGALQRQLVHSVEQDQLAAPLSGVHVIAGPSGAGKSSMVARLAQAAALAHGCEEVMVISFHDQRAGAWNQAQLLNAQSGVDCLRAVNIATLKLLLEEHEHRQLILIDTAGVQMNERLAEIRNLGRDIACHAVIPADASAATLRRVFEQPDNVWTSLMLSKLDEASQPWALLQFLCDKAVPVSVGSRGDGLSDLVQDVVLPELVQRALDNLPLMQPPAAGADEPHPLLQSVAAAKLAEIAQRSTNTGAFHE
ncbi:MAG: Signal recognition particle 54 kDa protein [Pseudomonadota bacterium]